MNTLRCGFEAWSVALGLFLLERERVTILIPDGVSASFGVSRFRAGLQVIERPDLMMCVVLLGGCGASHSIASHTLGA